MTELLRWAIIAGYGTVAVLAVHLLLRTDWIVRRIVAVGMVLVAATWIGFYTVAVQWVTDPTPDSLQVVQFLSRLNHIPTIALLVLVLGISLTRDREGH